MQKENKPDWSEIRAAGKSRPFGISLLTLFHVIGSLFIIPGFVMLFSVKDQMNPALDKLGATFTEVSAGLVLVAFLVVGSAVGMFFGKRWGWWMAAYYYVHSVAQKSLVFINLYMMLDGLGATEEEFTKFTIKTIGRVCISLLILIYLFRPKVWDYFDLQLTRKWITLGILLGLFLVEILIFTALSFAVA